MASKKSGGASRNGRDSHSKRLGVKAFGGEFVTAGSIIIRQRGTKYHPRQNVGLGRDHTIFALINGFVTFGKTARNRTTVSVVYENPNVKNAVLKTAAAV